MLDQAANFLATSKDKNAKAEIERLMTAILPPRDNMDRFSAPEGAGSGGQQKLIRPAPPGEETACRALWNAGFPKDADSLVCQLYRDFDWGGHQYRVYYPDSRHSDPGFMQYVQDAEDALNDSLNKYSRFTSNIGDIDIIFALIQLDVVGSSGLPGSPQRIPGTFQTGSGPRGLPLPSGNGDQLGLRQLGRMVHRGYGHLFQ
jgi:hypothetical protein